MAGSQKSAQILCWMSFLSRCFPAGSRGAAAATAATQLFSALVCYGYLRRTPDVELVPGGDYAVLLHRKNDRLPWRWDDIRSMSEFLQKRGVTNFGDGFSCVGGSGEKNGSPVNFHKRMVKLIT